MDISGNVETPSHAAVRAARSSDSGGEKFRASVAQAFNKEKRLHVELGFRDAKIYGGGRSGWLGSSRLNSLLQGA